MKECRLRLMFHTLQNEFTGISDYFYSATIQGDKSLDSQKVADKVVSLLEKRHQCAGEIIFRCRVSRIL